MEALTFTERKLRQYYSSCPPRKQPSKQASKQSNKQGRKGSEQASKRPVTYTPSSKSCTAGNCHDSEP
ncbi:hypothetical protein E2C01_007164 [Portunus trituberculatus]|uniref:Uncharacterized protein n=1 Tax=Portunus trituberculatus TaxID=210409 RepID=A0A5B7CYF5_PORTR|nr:hypothetical protein [Portunus trituberculatus]